MEDPNKQLHSNPHLLSASEKAALKTRLMLFMEAHPLPIPSDEYFGTPSPIRLAPLQAVRGVFLGILIFGLIGGSVAAAAEGSLPGDALYGVKVNVNEEVRSAVTLSNEKEALWQAKRAERRLQEAEQLAVEGRLDATTTEELTVQFEKHADESFARAEKSDDINTKIAVHSDIEATLEAHNSVILTLAESNEELGEELEGVRTIVAEHAEEAEDARLTAEETLSASTTQYSLALLEERKEVIEEKIDDIDDSYTAVKKEIDPMLSDEIDDRIDDAERLYKKAEKALDREDLIDALAELQDALRTATEAEVLLSVSIILIPEPKEEPAPAVEGAATSSEEMTATSTAPDTATSSGASPVHIKVPEELFPIDPISLPVTEVR